MDFQILYEKLISDIDYEPVILFLEKYLTKNKLILDAGCGTGIFLLPLLNRGYLVEGIDNDTKMLSLADHKLKAANLHTNLYEHDLRNPISKKYDQIILMNDVINYFKGVKGIFRHLKNALNKEGFIVFDCYKYEYLNEMDGYLEAEEKPVKYEWEISVKGESMTHKITSEMTFTINQTIKPLSYYVETLEALDLKVEILDGPDDRKHYIKTSL